MASALPRWFHNVARIAATLALRAAMEGTPGFEQHTEWLDHGYKENYEKGGKKAAKS